jgi:hypothetical protein
MDVSGFRCAPVGLVPLIRNKANVGGVVSLPSKRKMVGTSTIARVRWGGIAQHQRIYGTPHSIDPSVRTTPSPVEKIGGLDRIRHRR